MAIYCDTCLGEICDFCVWYDFNGEEGGYSGDGYCRRWKAPRDPDDGCAEYHCHAATDGNSYSEIQKRARNP